MTKFLRFVIVAVAAIALQQTVTAQSVSINTTGAVANNSSILDVSSTTKGVLIPRMTKTEKNAIATPATGLLVYQSSPDSIGFHYYDGTKWVYIAVGAADSTSWKIGGNGNIKSTNFLGTTNDSALRFRIRNIASGMVDSTTSNTALGYKNLYGITTGVGNNVFGYMAGKTLSSGAYNTVMGRDALSRTGVSPGNIAIGDSAMGQAISTGNNIAIGLNALKRLNGNGAYTNNVAIGTQSQEDTTSAGISYYNTSVGSFSLQYLHQGYYNTAIGISALHNSDTSYYNTALGSDAMYFHKGPNGSNTALGAFTSRGDSIGYWNTALGSEAMDRYGFDNTSRGTGYSNVAVGFRALRQVRQGFENTGLGTGALEYDSSGNYNTAVGRYASFLNNRGDFNVSMGYKAAQNADTATNVVAIGAYAGTFNKQDNNVMIGYAAGYNAGSIINGDPKEITFVGYEAGRGSWYSNKNTAIGFRALSNTTASFGVYDAGGGRNTVIGDSAMAFSIGSSNTVIGAEALANASNPAAVQYVYNNVAIGDSAMGAAQSNSGNLFDNVALGFKSLTRAKNQGNIAVGAYAGNELGNTVWNTVVGYHALETDTTGSENTVMGTSAFRNNYNGIRNVSVGINTGLWSTSSNNTYIGSYSAQGINGKSTGGSNTAVGDYSLYAIRSGSQNVAMGENTLGSDSSGSRNTAIGSGSMDQRLRGDDNTALGFWAGRYDSSGNRSVYIGREAGYNNQENDIVAIGYLALHNNTSGASAGVAISNTAIGTQALSGNTIGASNTAIGKNALSGNLIGSNNTAVGASALANSTGAGNTGLGNQAGITNTTGTNNTLIGNLANVTATGLTNATAIGYNATVAQNNSLILGQSGTSVGINTTTPGANLDVSGTFSLGVNGSVLTEVIKAAVVSDVTSVAAGGSLTWTFSVPLATTGSTAFVSPSGALTNGLIIAYARVSAAATVEVKFTNTTGSAIDPASLTYYITVIK